MSFNTLISRTLNAFAPLGSEALVLPEQFTRIERAEIDGNLVMNTHFMRIAQKGDLRWVHITAPKIEVLTLFFFPHCGWQLPVYCMELVIFSAQPIVAMLDTVCLMPMACSDTVQHLMKTAHLNYPQLLQATDTPDWFEQCRSGLDFFIRPQNNEQLTMLSAVHLALLPQLNNLIQHAPAFSAEQALRYQTCLQDYKTHHRIHAPGLRLMNRSFGEQWTDDYMNYFFQ